MKFKLFSLPVAIIATLMFASCSLFEKDSKNAETTEENSMEVYADQTQNAILKVWDKAMEASFEGGRSALDSITTDSLEEVCGLRAFMDKSKVRPILTVNFGSFRCEYSNIVREGQVTLELLVGTSLAQKNSVAKFSFINYRVTDTETGKYVLHNGVLLITNLSGGVLTNLTENQPQLVHKTRSDNFHIFYSGSSGDIISNTARIKKFSKLGLGNNYEMIVYPDTTINGIADVADWGTLRNGKTFYHIITKPIYFESCSKRCRYIKGERVQKIIDGREVTTLFGVDKKGVKQHSCSAYGKLLYYHNSKGDSIGWVVKYK